MQSLFRFLEAPVCVGGGDAMNHSAHGSRPRFDVARLALPFLLVVAASCFVTGLTGTALIRLVLCRGEDVYMLALATMAASFLAAMLMADLVYIVKSYLRRL